MKRYRSELMQVTSLKTGKATFFVKKCDVFQRVSVAEYNARYESADGVECSVTRTSTKYRRSYITCIYEVA